MKITIRQSLLLFILFNISRGLFGQCSQTTYSFNTQEEVDNFPSLQPACTEINGNLIIQNTELNNLDSLIQITKVANRISIRGNDFLDNLDGLGNVLHCNDLEITNNSNLIDVSNISNIQELNGVFILVNNPRIQTFIGLNLLNSINKILVSDNDSMFYFNGFNEVININDFIIIKNNPKLSSLEICESTKTIGNFFIENNSRLVQFASLDSLIMLDTLRLVNNDQLTLLPNLDSLKNISGQLVISDNDTLKTINSLTNILTIQEDLLINNNRNLEAFTATNHLEFIGGKVEVNSNNKLNNIEGFSNVDYIYSDTLVVNNSPLFSNCQSTFAYAYIRDETKYCQIANNGSSCNSKEEVTKRCLVDLDESKLLPPFTFYTYPFDDKLYIAANNNNSWQKIEIFDSKGKLVQQSQSTNSSIDTSDLPIGYYYFRIHTQEGIYSSKLVK